ncbi:histone deacetylase, putative [Pediculus humanus corporis]|uniref:Histone deacetylase n=1 Tax=Pediculus humanus subsp. corporis TaxID=121224 RepID=E0VL90_PEDHC|nr:histone deacetylase, putative [Pediculus humanus corporis]EEB14146.1 histone deacetylase, putative [Pediculus humanus corporis]
MSKKKKYYYILDEKLINVSKNIPNIENRALVSQSLISSYNLLSQCEVCKCEEATLEDLSSFHSFEYIEILKKIQNSSDLEDMMNCSEIADFNLGYDCPLFEGILDFVKLIAGSSLTAAKKLIKKYMQNIPISINWFGGWHHAQRDEAGGFCYVNDIVIAIQYLLKFFKRILYIDLDVHHGNGVENAFIFSPRVLTFSIHKYEPGYFPSTGSIDDIGEGRGKFFTVNVPLKSGIKDDKYIKIFNVIFNKIIEKYKPDSIVVQCGADTLPEDPLGGFNVTPYGIGECLKSIINVKLPLLILGGGGYNIANTSKFWTYLTSLILNYPISNDIPPDDPFLTLYGPEYEIKINPSLRKDENDDDYIEKVTTSVLDNLNGLPIT